MEFFQLKEENVFEYLESIEDNALIVVSNYENDAGVDNGLIAGHAYAVTDFEGTTSALNLYAELIIENFSRKWRENCSAEKSMG